MNNFTFLTDEQIFGNQQLDIIKKYGTKCAITDFSILLGGYVNRDYSTSDNISGTGYWWTKTPYDGNARVVTELVLVIGTVLANVVVGLAQLYRSHQSQISPRTE